MIRPMGAAVSFKSQILGVAIAVLAMAAWFSPVFAQDPPEMERIPFVIATGPVGGSYMQAGEAIAVMVSHPPGLGRCETGGICGPRGLIATARSSGGSVANALAVEARTVQSALVQGDIMLAASKGSGPFANAGPLKDVRVLARLHEEAFHVVVSSQSRIRRLADLKGRRVAIDPSSADTEFTARTVLSAAGVRLPASALQRIPVEQAIERLRTRKVDAVILLGVAPVRSLEAMFRRGQARLLGVDNRTLQRLVRGNSLYGKTMLPAGAYRGSRQVQTLAVSSLWVVHRSQDPAQVAQMLRAFWARENRQDLEARLPFAGLIDLRTARATGRLPLHEGALRFYGSQSP